MRSRQPESRWRDLIAVCALVLPLVLVMPGGLFPFELAKLAGCGIAVVLAAVASVTGRLPQSLLLLVVGGAVVLAVAALLSADPQLALLGRWPRYQGAIALPLYAGMLWAGARLLGPAAPAKRREAFVQAVSIAMSLIAFVALLEAFGLRPIAGDASDRTGALLGTATDMGLVGAMGAVMLLGPVFERGRQALPAVGLVASLLLVLLAASRAGFLALGLGVVLLGIRLGIARSWVQMVVVGGVAIATLVVGLLLPSTAERLASATALSKATVANRALIWDETVQLLLHSGPVGVGPSGFAQAILRFQTAEWGRRVGFDSPIDSPHSVLFQALAGGGPLLAVVGLAVALLVVVAGFRAEIGRAPFAFAATGAAVGMLTTFPTAGTAPFVAVLIGGAVAVVPGHSRVPVRAVWTAVAGALTVLSLFGGIAEVPLRAARDAAQSGDLPDFESQVAAARAMRPWDFAVDSVAAQAATEASARHPSFLRPAVHDARRALQLAPGDHDTLTALAVALQTQGLDRSALPIWNQLIAQAPSDDGLLVHRLVSRANLGDVQGAIADARRAVQLNPRNAAAAHDLTVLLQATAG